MAQSEERDWLDEAFDDKKAQEEMERAQSSGRLGCLLAVVVALVFVFVIVAMVGMFGALQSI